MTNNKSLYFAFLSLTLLFSCAPKAYFLQNSSGKIAPQEVAFENQSQKADSYEWEFGDGTTSTEENPKHSFLHSGNYTVRLKATKGKKTSIMVEKIKIEKPEKCLVLIETPKGNMLVELYDNTPLHRDNFLKLADEGFYDDLLFHRVIDGFMIQGGDPQSKNAPKSKRLGSGGPGYQIPAEFVDENVHIKGALAAARTGGPGNPEKKSSGSQFYIVHGNKVPESQLKNLESRKGLNYSKEDKEIFINQGGTPFLDKEYTVFGRVIEGLDIIDKIAATKTASGDRPEEDMWMKITVIY